MLQHAKVIWFEGMLLTPQHFQQQERYFEYALQQLRKQLGPQETGYGLQKLVISPSALALGKIVIEEVAGIFPDGTPFFIDAHARNALINKHLTILPNIKTQLVYLCLPLTATYQQQGAQKSHPHRYQREIVNLPDVSAEASSDTAMVMGMLNLQLRLAEDDLSNYTVIPIAKIKCSDEQQGVVLEENFIPPLLTTKLAPALSTQLLHIAELIKERVKTLAERISHLDCQNKIHFNELLLLQTLNRHLLVWQQAVRNFAHPPGYFYNLTLSLLGDLATFTVAEKYWPEPVIYQHDNLEHSFVALLVKIRLLLNKVIDCSAVIVPLEKSQEGYWLSGLLAGVDLEQAKLILAIKAEVAQEELQKTFPNQVKIAGADQIQDLIYSHLPGLALSLLPTVPSVLSYHAGFVYFQVQKNQPLWSNLVRSGQMALHVAGAFPKLEIRCWLLKDEL
jgi:type VI secretion system protein ImpJ